jgi:hypothetical protein
MPRRLSSLLLSIALLVLPVAAHAQLGGLTRRVKLPRVATGQPEKPASDQPVRPIAPVINAAMVDQLLAGLTAESASLDQIGSAARTRAEAAKTAQVAPQQAWLDKVMHHEECKDQHHESDSETANRERLNAQASSAQDRGDKKKAEQLNAQADKLEQEINARAEAACTSLAPTDADYKAATANQDIPDEWQARRSAADTAARAGAAVAKLSPASYAQVKELVTLQLRNPGKAGLSAAEAAAIDAKRADLSVLLRAVGA